jgi:hypothetical protein
MKSWLISYKRSGPGYLSSASHRHILSFRSLLLWKLWLVYNKSTGCGQVIGTWLISNRMKETHCWWNTYLISCICTLNIVGVRCYIAHVMFVKFLITLWYHEMFSHIIWFERDRPTSSQLSSRAACIWACNDSTTDVNIFVKFCMMRLS